MLDREYPSIKIEFIELDQEFSPFLIQQLSKEYDIPVHFMFIGSLNNDARYRVEELGGVRLII